MKLGKHRLDFLRSINQTDVNTSPNTNPKWLSMKLQRQIAVKKKDKTYYKWVVTIPGQIVEQNGWKDGTKLTVKTKDQKLILEASK